VVDILERGGDTEEASRTRVTCVWDKLNELAQLLAMKGALLRLKGNFCNVCVQSVLV